MEGEKRVGPGERREWDARSGGGIVKKFYRGREIEMNKDEYKQTSDENGHDRADYRDKGEFEV